MLKNLLCAGFSCPETEKRLKIQEKVPEMTEEKKRERSSFIYLLILAGTGLAAAAVCGFLILFTGIPDFIPIVAGAVVFAGAAAALIILTRRRPETVSVEKDRDVQSMIADVLKKMDLPVVMSTVDGKVAWANNEFRRLCEDGKSIAGRNISEFCGVEMHDVLSAPMPEGAPVEIGGVPYKALSYIMPTEGRDFWMTVFINVSDAVEAQRRVGEETAVVVYAVLDNLDSLSQIVKTSYREAVIAADAALRAWAAELGGFVRDYDGDKFLICFPLSRLPECVENGFEILDRVRRTGLGDSGMSVTLSMGVSSCEGGIKEREADAAAALETALQRGGDQVVLRGDNGSVAFFGGKTKTDLSRTKIRSRTVCARLIQLIGGAGNVLIMGHRDPDFDAIGACVGLTRIALSFTSDVHVVTDRNNSNFRTVAPALIAECPEYEKIFIGGDEALDMIRSDTLLIIADVNNLKIVESPEVASNVASTVVIDHHRKTADYPVEPLITFIEPGTSSTCELVTEMIESLSEGSSSSDIITLNPAEADMLLAGITLDTKNFTRSTGEETFSAAFFLRSKGASSETVTSFFFNDVDEFISEARLGANLRRYRDRIAITADRIADGDQPITQEDRVAAAKAAESLLTVRGIDAAFAMVYNDDTVLISGRSNGSVNVQLILEKLGGGGRFDAAGAQLTGKSFQMASEMLKEAIDETLAGQDEAGEKN